MASDGLFGSNPTGGVEIAIAGWYLVTLTTLRNGGTGGNTERPQIKVNGALVAESVSLSVSVAIGMSAVWQGPLELGDTVVGHEGTVTSGGKSLAPGSALALTRIGPVRWT